jgi:iron complex outermembrane recepter protein
MIPRFLSVRRDPPRASGSTLPQRAAQRGSGRKRHCPGEISAPPVTADVFRTDIDNRIALSDPVSGTAVLAVLAANGVTNVQQAAFFVNALNTRTQGVDVSIKYDGRLDARTFYHLSFAYELSPTGVRSLVPNPVLDTPSYIGTHARLLLTQAQPVDKIVSGLSLDHGPFTAAVNVTRYGSYVDAPILDPQTFSPKIVTDLSLTARLPHRLAATFGVLNVGNVYPDQFAEQALAFKSYGGAYLYGEESPFGVDGRAYYVRLSGTF